MTIDAWKLVLAAITPALLLVGGFYLNKFVKHQVDAKDATIEFLRSAISAQQAEISSLKRNERPQLPKTTRWCGNMLSG
jgi:hypothetical protein